MMRALIGFLIAPFPAALFQSTIVALQPKGELGLTRHPSSMFVAIILYFYFMGLIAGVPTMFAMRRRKNHKLTAYAGGTALIMLAPIMLGMIKWALHGHLQAYIALYFIAFFGFGGALAGALYWVIAQPERERRATQKVFD